LGSAGVSGGPVRDLHEITPTSHAATMPGKHWNIHPVIAVDRLNHSP
jgi:hypothetical protein